jgi:hypothetical protein
LLCHRVSLGAASASAEGKSSHLLGCAVLSINPQTAQQIEMIDAEGQTRLANGLVLRGVWSIGFLRQEVTDAR